MRAFIPMNLLPAFYANLNAFNEISKCLFYYPIKRIYTLFFSFPRLQWKQNKVEQMWKKTKKHNSRIMNISCIYHNVELENLFVFYLLNGLYRMMIGALGGLEKGKSSILRVKTTFFCSLDSFYPSVGIMCPYMGYLYGILCLWGKNKYVIRRVYKFNKLILLVLNGEIPETRKHTLTSTLYWMID